MRSLLANLIWTSFLYASAASAGAGHSGGGTGIVLKSGEVLMSDLIQPSRLDHAAIATQQEV
ncbi:MAG: hypothetical protein EOP04_31125, partial [Proteobacteria bacterium]